jgi:hypothetical protein
MAKKFSCICNKCNFEYEFTSGTNGMVSFFNFFCKDCNQIDSFSLGLKQFPLSEKMPKECIHCNSKNIIEVKDDHISDETNRKIKHKCPNCSSASVIKKLKTIIC